MYAVVFSFGGIPLIYMGDELAVLNDPQWADDLAHEDDNRWMHRPAMDWAAAARRHDPETVEGRMFAAIRALVAGPPGSCPRWPRAAAPSSCRQKTTACWPTGGSTRAARRSWP